MKKDMKREKDLESLRKVITLMLLAAAGVLLLTAETKKRRAR